MQLSRARIKKNISSASIENFIICFDVCYVILQFIIVEILLCIIIHKCIALMHFIIIKYFYSFYFVLFNFFFFIKSVDKSDILKICIFYSDKSCYGTMSLKLAQ